MYRFTNWIVKSLIIKTDSRLTLVIICKTFGSFWNKLFCFTPKLVSVWALVKIFCTENLKAMPNAAFKWCECRAALFTKLKQYGQMRQFFYEKVCLKVTWRFFFQYGNVHVFCLPDGVLNHQKNTSRFRPLAVLFLYIQRRPDPELWANPTLKKLPLQFPKAGTVYCFHRCYSVAKRWTWKRTGSRRTMLPLRLGWTAENLLETPEGRFEPRLRRPPREPWPITKLGRWTAVARKERRFL